MRKKFLTFTLSIVAIFCTHAFGQEKEAKETIDTLRDKLTAVKTASDSLSIYYDILDLTERKDIANLIKEMYGVATRAGSIEARLDLCRQVTAVLRDDSHFAEIEREVASMPASEEQKETELFLKMKRVCYISANMPEADRQKEVTNLITKFESDDNPDKYEELLELFSLVEYLRHVATGEMLDKYMAKLYKLLDDRHFQLYVLPNTIYAESANIYSDAGEYSKAVKADRSLLEVIDNLEKKYKANGRHYRNYDVSRYVCYRRMLRNYQALGNGEAEELYAKIKALAAKNPDVKNDLESNPRTMGFYYMAVNDYNSAIPYLKKTLDGAGGLSIRRQVLEALVKATEQTGDNETRLYVLSQYKHINDEYNRLKAIHQYNELQIKYDLKSLEQQNEALLLQNRTEEAESARRIMTFLLVAFIVLAIVLFFSLFEWKRFRTNKQKMGNIVDMLRKERNKLVENYFDYNEIKTIIEHQQEVSHLNPPKGKEVSTYMTECIFNHLLNISLMGGNDRIKYIQECSVDRIMREAAAKASVKFDNPSDISVEYPEEDYRIISDKECLVDTLVHLIESMAILGGSGNKIEFSVHHTGHGHTNFIMTNDVQLASIRNEAEIFSHQHITNEMMNNGKNGLYICRMIALKIDCTFTLDRTYTEGARYVLSVPDDITHMTQNILCWKKILEIKQ